MKSFITYPKDLQKKLFPEISDKFYSERLIAYSELYEKVNTLEGSIVKCGITTCDDFARFAIFNSLISDNPVRQVIAFQKFNKDLYFDNGLKENGTLLYKNKQVTINIEKVREALLKKGITHSVNFIPGNVGDSIPEFLIENPEFKIAYLHIDMNDFEASFTILQFFYPRLVHDGILVLDNYYKRQEDFEAITEFFKPSDIKINNFTNNLGPHFIVRN